MRWRGPIKPVSDVNGSVAEEQPEQKDHRDWHTQQPQQNSASHRLLLVFALREDNAVEEGWFLSGFRNLRQRQANLEQ